MNTYIRTRKDPTHVRTT